MKIPRLYFILCAGVVSFFIDYPACAQQRPVSISQIREQIQRLESLDGNADVLPEIRAVNNLLLRDRRARLHRLLSARLLALRNYQTTSRAFISAEENGALKDSIRELENSLRNFSGDEQSIHASAKQPSQNALQDTAPPCTCPCGGTHECPPGYNCYCYCTGDHCNGRPIPRQRQAVKLAALVLSRITGEDVTVRDLRTEPKRYGVVLDKLLNGQKSTQNYTIEYEGRVLNFSFIRESLEQLKVVRDSLLNKSAVLPGGVGVGGDGLDLEGFDFLGRQLELGAHFSTLAITGDSDAEMEPGLGAWLTYNLSNNVALEAELNLFPRNIERGIRTGGRIVEGLFGIKAGQHFKNFGIFAKARPGFVSFSFAAVELTPLSSSIGVSSSIFQRRGVTHFAMDTGGVFEFYPTNRIITRFDLGDTIIRYGRQTIQTFSGQSLNAPMIITLGRDIKHNFQFNSGIGFRF